MMPMLRTLLLLALALLPVTLPGAEPWNLRRALAEAREASPDARRALLRLEQAEAQLARAEAARLPQLGLRAGYTQTTDPMQGFGMILSQGTFTPDLDFNDPGQLDALDAGLELNYAVYTGGARAARREAARARLEAARHSESSALASLDDAVVAAYLGIRQADAVADAQAAGVEALEESLRVARANEEAGELLRTERLHLEVELARQRHESLAATHASRLARRQFAFLLGLPADHAISLVEEDPALETLTPPEAVDLSSRSELQAAQAGEAAGLPPELSMALA
ncbi:MAG: TolC family protein, partial [Opitutales bacterium]